MPQCMMLVTFWWILLPNFSSLMASLPKSAGKWDYIGTYKLRDGTKDRTINVYYYDTDSVAEKQIQRQGWAASAYPNFFALHAVFQDDSGKWFHKELLGVGRTRFVGVQKSTGDALVLQLRHNVRVDLNRAKELGRNINEPFTRTICFMNGELAVK